LSSQDNQDLTQYEDQNYLHTKNQDNPHHNDLASLDTIIHHETLMKIILQDTLYDDPFLYMCHFFRSLNEDNRLTYSTIRKHSHLDARQTLLGPFFFWPRRPPPKSNILIIHFLFSWARRPPPKPNIYFFCQNP
jgi:hypothetical protein